MFYTGIGSRQTPDEILPYFKAVASLLEGAGYVLRSGGAVGADQAFESGVKDPSKKQIFYANDATEQAMEIAKNAHPGWNCLNDYGKKLHARNVMQVLGADLKTPSKFLLAWTPCGWLTGGSRTALVIAMQNKVPVYNAGTPEGLFEIQSFLKRLITQPKP